MTPQRRDADDQQHGDGDETPLTERARDRPRLHAAAHVHLERDHQQREPTDAPGAARALQREAHEPRDAGHRERRPEEVAVCRRHEHLDRVRRAPGHLPGHQP